MYGKVQDRSPERNFTEIRNLLLGKFVEAELHELAYLRLVVRI